MGLSHPDRGCDFSNLSQECIDMSCHVRAAVLSLLEMIYYITTKGNCGFSKLHVVILKKE